MDICLFFSDQHSYSCQGYAGNSIIRTPNLDRIANAGVCFDNNYTPYPLCVPARMSLMSGQLASRTGVMDNFGILDSSRATFAHSLNSIGYETVLCGRMHFTGPDQRHGFSKRIAGDITPIYLNRPTEAFRKERGVHLDTPTGGAHAVSIIGGGNSPTLEFDRYVVQNAIDYLKDSYDKPQFLCVGTYAPHHPYVAPKELYDYYLDKVEASDETIDFPISDYYKNLFVDKSPEVVKAVRASYYAMVEFMDLEVGMVYDAFQEYLKRTGHEGVFIYASDHGDHIGNRGLYGKETFYEESSHTPMIFIGNGIVKGKRIKGSTSLLDLGATICDIAGAPIADDSDSVSLIKELKGECDDLDRMVISELGGAVNKKTGEIPYAQMVKKGSLKYVRFFNTKEEAVYDIAIDPHETANVINKHQAFAKEAKAYLDAHCESIETIESNAIRQRQNLDITLKCTFDSDERWRCPDCARHYPEEMVSGTSKTIPVEWK